MTVASATAAAPREAVDRRGRVAAAATNGATADSQWAPAAACAGDALARPGVHA